MAEFCKVDGCLDFNYEPSEVYTKANCHLATRTIFEVPGFGEQNVVISPAGIVKAFAAILIALGDGTPGADKLLEKMGITEEDGFEQLMKAISDERKVNSQTPSDITAIAIFVNDRFTVKTAFDESIENTLGQKPLMTNFLDQTEAADEMNKWAADRSCQKIQTIIDESEITAAEEARIADLNYFDRDWATPFDKQTIPAPFQFPDGTGDCVAYMHVNGFFRIGEIKTEELTTILVLIMPYKDSDFLGVFLLPENGAPLSSLSEIDLWSVLEEVSENKKEVEAHIPKFSISSHVDLGEVMEGMGLNLQTLTDGKLNGMFSLQGSGGIDAVYQDTSLTVNQEGTKALACTSVVCHDRDVPVDFTCDHPFFFAILNERTGTVPFYASVVAPDPADPCSDSGTGS